MAATRQLIEYAKHHGGIISTGEALELGIAGSTLDRRVSEGIFVRLGRGILALPGTSTRPDVLMRAAGRLLGAVVSHQSAARFHHFDLVSSASPTVTVPHRGTHTFPGLTVHQSTDLLPEHVVTINAFRVTNAARTILDLAKVTNRSRMEQVVDHALAAGLVDFEDLARLFLALTRQGKKGMKHMRQVLADREDDSRVTETVIERRLFRLLTDAGLEAPTRQFHAPWLEAVDGRVDFAYVTERVVVEADSRRWHRLFDAFEVDRRRDISAQLAGWIVLRITWRMIEEDPAFVVGSIRRALSMRSGAVSGGS